ncbi:MAG: bi-domain-containing oxidoreductase [Candidatus Hydrothermia bacterium]|jgi:polar amino acid transport system substrate-binding protein
MKILVQDYKNFKPILIDAPYPKIKENFAIVKTLYSAISVGTELSRLKTNLFNIITERKDQIDLVIKSIKTLGISETFKRIINKLNTYGPLGYSISGVVVESKIDGINEGDYVIGAGGEFALHSEYNLIPKNLILKIPKDINLKEASFSTIGAIALNSIRIAKPEIGETFLVIGLGLIGQIVIRILNLMNIKTIGIDISEYKLNFAKNYAYKLYNANEKNLIKNIYPVDGVILCANDKTGSAIKLACEVLREKGRIVVVGQSKLLIPYKEFYYKELEIKMSRAYGAGRYDPNYEIKGIDYPESYVKWTINRNLLSFVEILPKLNLSEIITHEFEFKDALKAYEFLKKEKNYLGVVFKYSKESEIKKFVIVKNYNKLSKINMALIGAGSYAQNVLIPNFLKYKEITPLYLITSKPENAINLAKRYNFKYAGCDYEEVFKDENVNLIVIATPHNLHAELVKLSILNNKAVYVEKPLAINLNELEELKELYEKNPVHFCIGFNRRFSKLTEKIKEFIKDRKFIIFNYFVNAGILENHWILDLKIGGGRLIGEGCHFIDYVLFLFKEPNYYFSNKLNNENFTISFRYNNAICNVIYHSQGNKMLEKETIRIDADGQTLILKDFFEIQINNKTILKTKQDKGQEKLIELFIKSLLEGKESPISFESAYYSSLMTIKIANDFKI